VRAYQLFLPEVFLMGFRFGFENGFGIALLGTEIIFLAASRNRSHASGPSIIPGALIVLSI
jgi:hypothetical protein